MKTRIMSKTQMVRELLKERTKLDEDDWRSRIPLDMMLHVLADGKEVKVFNDTAMGGTVVEIAD